MTVQKKLQTVWRHVTKCHFVFIRDDEVRKMSVLNINKSATFDKSGSVLSGGLYDRRMGPIDAEEKCLTCNLSINLCSGHPGFIELPVPLYKPSNFRSLCKIIQLICINCLDIRISSKEILKFQHSIKMITSKEAKTEKLTKHREGQLKDKKTNHYHDNHHSISRFVPIEYCSAVSSGSELVVTRECIKKLLNKTHPSVCYRCNDSSPMVAKRGSNMLSVELKLTNNLQRGKNHISKYFRLLTVSDVENIIQLLWGKNWFLLGLFHPIRNNGDSTKFSHTIKTPGKELFFLRCLVVPANRYRPLSRNGKDIFEHPKNLILHRIVSLSADIKKFAKLDEHVVKLVNGWLELQIIVNCLSESNLDGMTNAQFNGVREIIEKKEGIFVKSLMGKRVNFAARSVLSPDPYIDGNEVGISPSLAMMLSIPSVVTTHNVKSSLQLVMNGSESHPGANAIEDNCGQITLLSKKNHKGRVALARSILIANGTNTYGKLRKQGVTIYRYIQDKDMVLVNRQPTLHKPGILAQYVRVLENERPIRIGYANCHALNADFDGDEINLHVPQSLLCQSECVTIVQADHHFVVPTNGRLIRGLIQDQIIAGILLTKRDTFLEESVFMQLFYFATRAQGLLELTNLVYFPAIMLPTKLWTGKQLLSAIMKYLFRDILNITFIKSTKFLMTNLLGAESEEKDFFLWKNEVISGTLDKGTGGLLQVLHELCGEKVSGYFLTAVSRLLMHYLHLSGFSCGVDDLALSAPMEKIRANFCSHSEAFAIHSSAEVVGRQGLSQSDIRNKQLLRDKVCSLILDTLCLYQIDFRTANIERDDAVLNGLRASPMVLITLIMPIGFKKNKLFKNCMTLMTLSGARGSIINFSQISCMMGQQELEGTRVPVMLNGKSLPCYKPFDLSARSGGFVCDRFFSGLKPQEFFFHSMAGRNGLIDTAIKTSRSGYIHRCMVKTLESLKTHYDMTVRDDTDSSIVEFHYGDDGVDSTQTSKDFYNVVESDNTNYLCQILSANSTPKAILQMQKKGHELYVENELQQTDFATVRKPDGYTLRKQSPLNARYFSSVPGILPNSVAEYIDYFRFSSRDSKTFRSAEVLGMLNIKLMRTMICAGEGVGIIAAQSLGEPATQMTLNTFHAAGRKDSNVTLGIPRLREILLFSKAGPNTEDFTVEMLSCACLKHLEYLCRKKIPLEIASCVSYLSIETHRTSIDCITKNKNNRLLHFGIHHQKFPLTFEIIVRFLGLWLKDFSTSPIQRSKRSSGSGKMNIAQGAKRVVSGQRSLASIHSQCPFKDFERTFVRMEWSGSFESYPKICHFLEDYIDCSGFHHCVLSSQHSTHLDLFQVTKQIDTTPTEIWMDVARLETWTLSQKYPLVLQIHHIEPYRNYDCADLIECRTIFFDEIRKMMEIYGIEAARCNLSLEIHILFEAYGTSTGARHLGLVADFLFQQGIMRQCNRQSMIFSSSPLQQISFETAGHFLLASCMSRSADSLMSPSACVAFGRKVPFGTGWCEILYDFDTRY
eukprot:gnl/MRDRNA2_/MRDRNA2_86673_c0_seq1.p1 gnl/MRDRNA2_/MRDRNA2_86673_c0~~gnl/MRDRNA2_/MRDRNA2_86673_c0_seq1.p1  ORF type:complete len:1515 (+),score=-18.05 gnl/MRDRNA2_/MRDRNA2_86673_c0_seq1:72-4616(+)